ncbi:MAG: hypothetical protein QM598_04720 [Protaetiibacter sp.]
MPGDDVLYPPAQYSPFWLLLVLAVLLAIVGVAVLVAVLTRPRRLVTQPAVDGSAVLAQLRIEYGAAIDDVERRVRSGELGARRAHAELSRLMRAFVNEYSGLEAPVLTLQDLVAQGVHPALVDALGRFTYPSLFRRGAPVDPVLGVQAARQVVQSWH